jgi:hypothetical protein
MNKQQEAAIRRLERAFKACGDAGLAVFAMDNNVYAVRLADYDPTKDFHANNYQHNEATVDIRHKGVFVGAGGW